MYSFIHFSFIHFLVRSSSIHSDVFNTSQITEVQMQSNSNLHCLFCLVYRLQAVSTNVGGVSEVLPSDMLYLADPSVQGNAVVLF